MELEEKDSWRCSIWERSEREKGTWSQMGPSSPAISRRGKTGGGLLDLVLREEGGAGSEVESGEAGDS